MINVMERIGDHLCNVVERVIEFNDRTSDEPGGDGSESPSEPPQSPTPKTVSRSPQPEGVTGS
jgi:phosphate uptake regulator